MAEMIRLLASLPRRQFIAFMAAILVAVMMVASVIYAMVAARYMLKVESGGTRVEVAPR
jgi:uncharacterized membrane protein